MKKLFTLICLGVSAGFFAQSFSVYQTAPNGSTIQAITNGGGYVDVTSPGSGARDVKILIKNTSASTQTLSVIRKIVSQTPALVLDNSQTTPNTYFCFGNTCFGSATNEADPQNYTILAAAGQTLNNNGATITDNSTTSGEPFVIYFMEAATAGSYIVRYKVFNVSNPNDTLAFTVNYNATPQFNFQNVYGFNGVAFGTGSVDPTPVQQGFQGATFGPFTAVGTSSNSVNPGVFSFFGWPVGATDGNDAASSMTAQINTSKYYDVTITPGNESSISLSSVSFDVDRLPTGPRNYAVRSSLDNYAANISSSVTSNSNLSVNAGNEFLWNFDATYNNVQAGSKTNLAAPVYKNISSPVHFRFYSWNAEDEFGSFAIDNVVFKGTSFITTGIGTLSRDLNASFKLYPNPSNDGIVTLESSIPNAKIEVINILGSVVLSQDKNTGDKLVLNLNTVPAGSYFVKITSGNGYHVEKLIISK